MLTQPDPTGQDPHYTYAGNNPVNFVDPTGADYTFTITARDFGAISIATATGTAVASAIAAATGVGTPVAVAIAVVGASISGGFALLANYGCNLEVNVNTGILDQAKNGLIDVDLYGCSRT